MKILIFFIKYLIAPTADNAEFDITNQDIQDNVITIFQNFASINVLQFPDSIFYQKSNVPIHKQYSYVIPRRSKANPLRIGKHKPGTLLYYDPIILTNLDVNIIEQTKKEMWDQCYSGKDLFAYNWINEEFHILKDKKT